MKHDDVDYTADFRVKLLPSIADSCSLNTSAERSPQTELPKRPDTLKCYGLVVWFDTAFSRRFCQEKAVNLTTSPHSPKTHWSQTLLTFKEPISLCVEGKRPDDQNFDRTRLGSDDFPAYSIGGRISIARSFRFRSIDISLEATAFGADGVAKSWPVQIFDI
jgi:protein arginine N-methyltransferase 3